jgi:hypothetical protein
MTDRNGISLFSVMQVSVATFLGAPLAGAFLISQNHKALGQGKAARQSLVTGVIGTVILMGIAFFLPDNFPNLVLPIVSIVVLQQWYQKVMGETFNKHVADGGKKGSWVTTVGVGLLCLVLIIAILVGVVMMLPEHLFE